MRLTFTKRDGRTDDLTIRRSDGSIERVAAPKQGILPHDMIHYAVECTLPAPGFLSMVAAGHPIAFAAMESQPGLEAVERLVETMQAEMWSGPDSATDPVASLRDLRSGMQGWMPLASRASLNQSAS